MVLGLTLFDMFINDLEINIKSLLKNTADDTKINAGVNSGKEFFGAVIWSNLGHLVNGAFEQNTAKYKIKHLRTKDAG